MRRTVLRNIYSLFILLCFLGVGEVYGAGEYIIEKPVETVGVCPDELPYHWHSHAYYHDGIYLDTIKLPGRTSRIKDTLEIYTLEFFTMPIRTVHAEITEGNTLSYRGKQYPEAGLYYDTIRTGTGCDSLIRLYISYADYFHMYDTAHICEGSTYSLWRGRDLSIAGNYFDSLVSAGGKDSIYQMTLIVHYPAEVFDTVQFCPDAPEHYYYWNGKRYNKDGDYEMKFKSPYGCDSVCHLHLTFLTEPQHTILTEYFCANIGVVLDGKPIYEATTVIDTFPSRSGCDSIVETHYIPHPSQFFEQILQHFEGDPVEWRGNIYTESGIYYDSLTNVYGCDSVYQLRLLPMTETYITINRCEGELVMHDDKVINSNTIIRDTLHNSMGGDSIIQTSYNFTRSYLFTEHITICSNQYVEWVGHNQVLHEAGIYRDAYRTASGCDSIYEINVTISPAYLKDTVVIWCNDSLAEKGPFRWTDSKGVTHEWNKLNTDTTIIDTMSHTQPEYLQYIDNTEWTFGSGGCDSISQMRIVITDRCSELDSIPLCYGSSVTVDSKVYTQPGRYFTLLPSSLNLNLRDSTHSFEIYYVYPTEETIDTTVCQSDLPIYYNDKRLTQAGTYDFHLQTQYGCDSLIHLNLSVTPTKYSPINELQYCPDEQFELRLGNGQVITKPGDYNDTVPWQGCDSIIRWRIRWAPTNYYSDTAYFKPGTTYTWHQCGTERILDTEGVYWDSCKNVYGCDSVYHLYLKEAEPFYLLENPVSLCTSQLPWKWHGKLINEAGVYFDSCHTYFGLDSVYEIHVSMYPSYLIEKQVTVCPDEKYYVNGVLVTGNTYRDEQQTVNGCDSVTVYYINRSILTTVDETVRFAENTVYPWHQHLCTHGGDYYDTLRSSLGCDSVIYHLHLIEEHAFQFFTDTAVCLSGGEQVEWHGQFFSASGTYYDSLTTQFGLDSIWQLNLTVHQDTVVQWHASLCNGGAYNFFGHELTTPGTYRSQPFPRTETGCDSIIELILQPVSTEPTIIRYTICEGDNILIGDSNVTTAGVYLDTLVSSLGCDSVLQYIVTVGKQYFFSSEQLINPGTSYTWHRNGAPVVLTVPGTYWDSCRTVLGCDSIYKLTLILNTTEYIFPTDSDYICSADLPYVWHHRSLTETGLYYDSLKTNLGLDSVYSLYLTVYTTMHTRQELHFCQGERPVIDGIPYESDAVFTHTLVSSTGCDSIVDYVLHFHPIYSASLIVNLRDGEAYRFGDTVLTTSGTYYRHFYSQFGCDSLVTVTVKACQTAPEVTIRHDLCQGESLSINGKTITTAGTYYETRMAEDGCDSLICHIVNVHSGYLFNASVTMCKGETYRWIGHHGDIELTRQGVYYDSLTTTHGCDSIYRLILNYKRTDVKDTIINICASDLPYTHHGKLYHKDSVFIDTLGTNTDGCDSLLYWHYNVNPHCSDYVQYNLCPGQIINIDGLLISQEGAYQQHHLTVDGQDSLYRFIVHKVQNYEFTTYKNGCDSVEYNGHTYYARGTGQETFTVDLNHRTIDGCDSIEHLVLTIHMSSPARVYSKTIADYDSIRFGPYYYNTTGSYSIHYTNAKGCDSTEILNLTVLETEYQEMLHYFICEHDARGVEVFGKRIYPTEEYTYISDSTWIAGKPVIRTADIVMEHPFVISYFDPNAEQIVCSDHEVLFYVNYGTKDRTILPDYYDVDFYVGDLEAYPLHQEGTVDGKTTLPILMSGRGKYVTPGYYRYRLTLRSEACVMSDTILEGAILIRYPENIMESAWDDAVLLVNEKYNGGGWVFKAPYKWQILSAQGVDKTARVVGDATQPYLYSSELEEGDRISAILYREGYNQPVPSCEYIFTPTLPTLDNSILIYPSAVKAHMPVTIKAQTEGTYTIVDQTGRLWKKGYFFNGETKVTMPAVMGCYIIVTEYENGNRTVQKLIVY